MFKVLEGATAPTRATKYSAMVDLYANADVVIGAGETHIVPLGVKIDKGSIKDSLEDWEHIGGFMESHYLELHPRSSLRAKGLIIGVGVIDLDFPDELGLIVHNPITNVFPNSVFGGQLKTLSKGCIGIENFEGYPINKGDKVAQICLKEHKSYLLGYESEVERVGGFGHSGARK